ncbi:hypothetical protein D3C77_456570 [compost metagenome]
MRNTPQSMAAATLNQAPTSIKIAIVRLMCASLGPRQGNKARQRGHVFSLARCMLQAIDRWSRGLGRFVLSLRRAIPEARASL